MDEKYIQDLFDQLGGEKKFGKFDDFKHLMGNDSAYRKDFYDAFGEKQLGAYQDFDALVKKKDTSNNVATPSGDGLSGTPKVEEVTTEEIPVVSLEDNQPDAFELAKQHNELKNKTIEGVIGGSSFAMGSASSLPDENSKKKAANLAEFMKVNRGVEDPEQLYEETKDLTPNDFGRKGFSKEELIADRQENPNVYQRKLGRLKWQSGLEKNLSESLIDGSIDKATYDGINGAIQSSLNSVDVGDYNQQRQNINTIANAIKTYGGADKEKLLSNYAIEVGKIYGNAYKNPPKEDAPESKFLPPNATLAYQYLKDVAPEKAGQYERLFIDPKSLKEGSDEKAGYDHLMLNLEENGIQLQQNAVNEDLNNLSKIAKRDGGLSPEQISQAEALQTKSDELTKQQQELETKYPEKRMDKVDDAVTEILGSRLNYAQYALGKGGQAIKNTAQGVWEAVSTPFMDDESNKMRELAIMGESMREEKTYQRSDATKALTNDKLIIQPELQKQIDVIVNDKSIEGDKKRLKLYTLLMQNTDKFSRVPIKGGKIDINPTTILFGVTDIATSLMPFVAIEAATGGIGGAGTGARLLRTFTAAAATTFHDEYANAIKEGLPQSQAYKQAMGITAINSAAMAGAGTAGKVREMIGGKTSAGEILKGMSDEAIEAVLAKGTPRGLKAVAAVVKDRVKATPKMLAEGAKTGAEFEVAMTAANELKHNLYNTPIDREQNFKQSLINIANFGFMGLLGHVGYKPPTEMQKSAIHEFGSKPEQFLAEAEKMKANGDLTPAEFEHRKDLIERSSEALKTLPRSVAKGRELTQKEQADYLYNTVIKNEAKKAKSTLPKKQAAEAEHTEMVADAKNDIILASPTDKQLESQQSSLEKKLEPKAEGETPLPEKEKSEIKAELDAVKETIEERKMSIPERPAENGNPEDISKPIELSVEPSSGKEPVSAVSSEVKTDADIEKRMAEIEDAKTGTPERDEFNSLEKEMEKRERDSIFNVPLENVSAAIDVLVRKEKYKPNGYGAFIEKRDARETKEVADKYLKPATITDAELKRDFSDAVRGNPTTWYADGLKMRESLKEATSRGIDTEKMLEAVTKVYTDAGYGLSTAKSVVGNMLKPVFEGSTENKPIQKEPNKQNTPETNEPVTSKTEVVTESKPIEVGNGAEPPKKEKTVSGVTEGEPEEWTAIRQAKLKEIDRVAKLFEKEHGTTWPAIQREALEGVANEYPDKTLYEAVKAKTELIASKYDNSIDYNPTSKDLAVIQEFKRQTEKKINQTKDRLNSDDPLLRKAAILEMESYENDRVVAAKALHKREAGTAFGFRQSESKEDSDYGLQIRRMELMKAQGGEKLSPEQEKIATDTWEKEKEILKREQEIKERQMQEDFSRELEKVKKAYDIEIGKTKSGAKAKTTASKIRTLADKIRNSDTLDKLGLGGTDPNVTTQGFSFNVKEAVAKTLEHIADGIEKGEAILRALKEVGGNKSKEFEDLIDKAILLATRPDRAASFDAIKEKAKDLGATELTNEMVKDVRDYVNSHIGDIGQKDLLSTATESLKQILPDITKKKLIEAYLGENEFKQQTRRQAESLLSKKKQELQNLAKLEEDINDLEEFKKLRQRKFGTEKEKTDAEEELIAKKEQILRDLQKERADAIKKQARKDKIDEFDANINRAKKSLDQIRTHRNKVEHEIDTEIEKKKKELKNAIRDYSTDEQLQKTKLEQVKKKTKADIERLKKDISEGNFEDPKPPVTLNRPDAELINLEKEKKNLTVIFSKFKKNIEEKNKGVGERLADFGRNLYVAFLIGGMKTFAKISYMAAARPFSEALTKQTAGRVFDMIFPGISKAAKRGGESSSIKSTAAGFGAYFRQMGEKRMNEKFDKANKLSEEATAKYEEYKNSSNPDKATLQKLKEDSEGKLLDALGNLTYKFIGGSSFKDAYESLVHRANQIEASFGGVDQERFKDGNWLDKTNYVLGFVGRSHGALKTFSGRFSFAAGFMARIEAAVKDGEDITTEKMIELAHESYLDFERGKYQQDNAITTNWNRMLQALRNKYSNVEAGEKKVGNTMYHLLKGDIAITRVPVNILHESVMEYTLGAFTSIYKAAKQQGLAKKAAKMEGLVGDDMRKKVKDIVSNMDEKDAATIARCFRKGGIGLGMYAFASLVSFGGFQYYGQRKKKEEGNLGAGELNPGQVQLGDIKLTEVESGMIDHTPAFYPLLMGKGIAYLYNMNIRKGKTTVQAAKKAILSHLSSLEGGIPQSKVVSPTRVATNVINAVSKRSEEYGLTDGEEDNKEESSSGRHSRPQREKREKPER